MVSDTCAEMESYVAEVISGQGPNLETRHQQSKHSIEPLDAETAIANAKADDLVAAAVSAHERISVMVNDMNVVKTSIESSSVKFRARSRRSWTRSRLS